MPAPAVPLEPEGRTTPWSGPDYAECGASDLHKVQFVHLGLQLATLLMLAEHLPCSKKLLRRMHPAVALFLPLVGYCLGAVRLGMDLWAVECGDKMHPGLEIAVLEFAVIVCTQLLSLRVLWKEMEVIFPDEDTAGWRKYRVRLVWVVATTPDSTVEAARLHQE
ncbi:unnamed protein product [Zymoseptoria tritici ST99CH_3D7]|nr:unnamed protein product [Zymoseptoria tritici ST99CH_3D7]SMR60658.1 unnamed protein product [Zymoseptoria tritici ST99CH_1E4]